MARHVDTWTDGADRAEGLQAAAYTGLPIPMLVVNPLSWAVTATVSVPYPITACTDEVGDLQPRQYAPSGEVTFTPSRTLLQLALPAMGYRRFWLHATGSPRPAPDDPSAAHARREGHGLAITNSLLDVGVDSVTGRVQSLVDRRTGRQWLGAEGIGCVVVDDASDTWSHGVGRYDGTERAWTCEGIARGRGGARPGHGAGPVPLRGLDPRPRRSRSTAPSPSWTYASPSTGTGAIDW